MRRFYRRGPKRPLQVQGLRAELRLEPPAADPRPPTLTFNEQDKKNLEHALTLLQTNRQAGEKIFLGITSSRDQQGPLADKPPSGLGQDLGASRSCCLKQLARQQLASGGRLNF